MSAYPELSGRRLLRELSELGYDGGYTAITDFLRDRRPPASRRFEVRFETPPGDQAQVDFAQFQVVFTDEPAVTRIVWLFSLVLGSSRLLWARFVLHQDLQTVLRCHIAAFATLGGVPREILYDRMKTAVIGEAAEGGIVYNRTLLDFARHYGFHPKACRPYRAKTKGKVERPFRYIREDFFLGRTFRNLDDLNAQLADWLETRGQPARARDHPPGGRRSLRRGEAEAAAAAAGAVRIGAQTGAARLARGHGLGRRQSLQRSRRHPRKRLVEVHTLADEIRIFEDGTLDRHAIPCSKGAASDGSPPATGRLRVVAEQAKTTADDHAACRPPRRARRPPLARLLRRRRPPSRRPGRAGMTAAPRSSRPSSTGSAAPWSA